MFGGSDGAEPSGRLIRGEDGKFYGTTFGGGTANQGTVFSMDNVGAVTTLRSFSGGDGSNPKAGLTKGSDGMLYGTTLYGGAGFNGSPFSGSGTIFKIDSAGQFALLHSFTGNNGGLVLSRVATEISTGRSYASIASKITRSAMNCLSG